MLNRTMRQILLGTVAMTAFAAHAHAEVVTEAAAAATAETGEEIIVLWSGPDPAGAGIARVGTDAARTRHQPLEGHRKAPRRQLPVVGRLWRL